MKTATVTLGGKAYTIRALPMRRAHDWRKRLSGPFGELTSVLEGTGEIEITDGKDLAGLVRLLNQTLIGSLDLVIDLLFDFSPELAADRERIEAEAYDDEAMRAFVEVLRLAYPFGELTSLVRGARMTARPTS